MAVQLKTETQKVIDQLLYGESDNDRNTALEMLPSLSDKQDVEIYLIDNLATEADVWKRTWTLSALAKLNLPQGTP